MTRTPADEPAPYIAVALDGTLAQLSIDGRIGEPVPAMLTRLKKWLEEGKTVKIVTPRVAKEEDLDNASPKEDYDRADAIRIEIVGWCEKHVGRVLDITCRIEPGMIELWDAKAVGVLLNRGVSREDLLAYHMAHIMEAAGMKPAQGQPYGEAADAIATKLRLIMQGAEDAFAHLDSAQDALEHLKLDGIADDQASLVRQARTSLVKALQPLVNARGK